MKKAIPRDQVFVDLRIPDESEVKDGLRRILGSNSKYRVVWLLCLEGGLRVVEAVSMVSSFDRSRLVELDGFYRYPLGMFRSCKQAYFAYFTRETLGLIESSGSMSYGEARKMPGRRGVLPAKYLRKFAFHKMVELGIPESVADFIQGRTPRAVGARHYMNLVRQADQYYPRYADYIRGLNR